jgi:uncharacterized protein YegL
MARYAVQVVVPDGRTFRLLIILSPGEQCSALRDKVKSRISALNLGLTSADVEINLHLDASDGPLLDTEDLLSDVLPDATDKVYAIVGGGAAPAGSETLNSSVVSNQQPGGAATGKVIRVRVITPELARSQPNVDAIPLLPENAVTFNSTLEELQVQVKRHLALADDGEDARGQFHDLRCNCGFARQIDSQATLSEHKIGSSGTLQSFVVVYENNKVVCLPVTEPTQSSLYQALNVHLSTETAGKKSTLLGGIRDLEAGEREDTRYLKLPVVALCSPQRHSDETDQEKSNYPRHHTVLDLHTSEMPIHLTAHNYDKTLAAVGLEDCMVNGVLNIYAIKRKTSDSMKHFRSVPQGKDAIFRQGLAWTPPLGSSERGLASFLCSIRMLANLTHARNMEASEQDAVLHVIMLLTKFPPAVRAVNVLMRGETPHEAERAAIIQSVYEVLKSVVPLHIIQSNNQRLLEGSRLLFGLVLEKAKHLKVSMHEKDGHLPYLDSVKVHELRNLITMEAVVDPVQTASGLVDREFFDAFKEGGPLRWINENPVNKASSFDRKLHRACLLSGGVKTCVVGFDIDAVNNNSRYADRGDVSKVIAAAEYSDLHYLSNLCGRNKLGVLHPSALPSADPPVLTLDRAGLLAMYVGRQACGEAGRDINMFRPTSTAVEEAVDVSIITQLLVPILERRNADGTAIFEAFGDQTRQIKDPDEVVVLCVDASASMDDRCGFIDVEENENALDDLEIDCSESMGDAKNEGANGPEVEDPQFDRPALDELKEYLSSHESFDDFLAITQAGTDEYHRHRNSAKVLDILRALTQRQVEEKTKALDNARRRGTMYSYRQQSDAIQRDLATLKNRNIRLLQYKDALVAFLLYRADNRVLDEPLIWTVGQDVPQVSTKSTLPSHNVPKLEIPTDFLCPISAELMEDPVTTIDGFTYERRNIERWFQTHETSPCTNVVLSTLDVHPNYTLKQSIFRWVNGIDIESKYPSTGGNTILCFKLPLGTITTVLPMAITMEDLYEKAFRMSKGRYPSFILSHCNTILIPSGETARPYLTVSEPIMFTPVDAGARSTMHNGSEDMCLVKVYANHEDTVFSYWEPKSTTKTLASIIFRCYRHTFRQNPWQNVTEPFIVWTGISYTGDNHYEGYTRDHWEMLSRYFDREYATGGLVKEPVYDKEGENEPSLRAPRGSHPLVLKVYLSGPPARPNHTTLTRLGVLKQMFDAYINRLLAYGYQTHLGLVTFRSTASLTQEVTHAIENFRHQLNNIQASGDTALWDAIALARDTLLQYATKYPKAKLRIICLSDGTDTNSKQQVHSIALGLIRDHITVDSFCLGNVDNSDLQSLSHLTGGYKFRPDQMEHAMAICEMEPVLSSLERPDIALPTIAKRLYSNPATYFKQAKHSVEVDVVTRDDFPLRKEHPLLSETYVELGRFARNFNIANRSDSNLRLARIHSEIRNSGAKVHPYYDIYICESNFSMWKIVVQGKWPSFTAKLSKH